MEALADVEAANSLYYSAFEARDLDSMSSVWEHSERVVCTHPGWATLRGWGRVASSYFAMFQSAEPVQFVLTNQMTETVGNMGWVSVDENLLGPQGGVTVAALNVFVRHATGWRMVCHHGSVVAGALDEAP